MIFLLLSILSSCLISIFIRLSSDKIKTKYSMLMINYLICAILSAIYSNFDLIVTNDGKFNATLIIGLISGVLYLASLLVFQRNTMLHDQVV